MAACPCGNPADYLQCCGRYHAGAYYLQAPTPEALMRSRYSAFVVGDRDYLLQSWHTSTRPTHLDLDAPGTLRWLGLEVRRHWRIDADHAEVEFVARSKAGGRPATRLHEISRFVREAGRWYYVDGHFPSGAL